MTTFDEWAARWRIDPRALAELRDQLCRHGEYTGSGAARSEADVQSQVRLEASRAGCRLWRNNVGACYDDHGNFIRYGLANENAALNRAIKSADLIGIRPVLITQALVGRTIGQFVSREIKAPGWRYSGDAREQAQLAWAKLVTALGGDGQFCNGVGSL
jgi:hypothetical protein